MTGVYPQRLSRQPPETVLGAWFSQESLTDLKLCDALEQIMEEIRKIRGARWMPGLKNWFLRKLWCWAALE